MRRSWGKSFIITVSGQKVYLETPYDLLEKEWKSGKKEIEITFATWYGIGEMLIPVAEISKIGIPD